jgi:hypothetical protein
MHQRKYPTEGKDLGLMPPGIRRTPIKMLPSTRNHFLSFSMRG